MKKQHYMTHDERQKLEALFNAGMPVAQIARQLGFCRQTIYNELRAGRYEHNVEYAYETRYSPDKAEIIHQEHQAMKGRPLKIGCHRAYAAFLEDKIIRERYSPAAALAEARRAGYDITICVSTLYSYIDKEIFVRLTNRHLWEKAKRRKQANKPASRVTHPQLPSIEERPLRINARAEYGHWEMDLVIGKAGNRAALMTMTERLTRQELIFLLPDRRALTIRRVFDRMERTMGKRAFREKFKSITTDNGPEFLEYAALVQSIYGGSRFDIYYCHSYAAWEKGSNENHNRIIRRWFPKGTNFSKVTKKQIADLQNWMNGYPRKSLNWLCPREAA